MEKSSSTVGYLISLGKEFIANKTTALDDHILPKVKEMLLGEVIHRVAIGYGVLIWFVLQVRLYVINFEKSKLHHVYRSCIEED